MAIQPPIVAGIFESESQARSALDSLQQAGFEHDQIGVAVPGKNVKDLSDNLQSLGLSQERAMYYDQAYKTGHFVVSVKPNGRTQDVYDILQRHGATNYDQKSSQPQKATTHSTSGVTQDGNQEPHTLQLREEQLQVSKEKLQTGEVHLRKEIVTEQKTITVPVSHEEVIIERYPVTNGQIATNPPCEDDVIRIPITEEQISVTKTPVVINEVKLGKRVVQENQQISDTLKREKLRVEHTGDIQVHDADKENLSK